MNFNYVVMPIIILAACIVMVWLSVRRMLSLSAKPHSRWRRVAERTVLSIVILIAGVVAGSTSYNAIALHHFWSRNPAPGKIVDVGGYRMHIHCTGNGSPTLILEAGGQNDSTIWRGIQPTLSKTTTVCAYDRAGSGWSDSQPGPRDADHVAAELHRLLLQVGINGPIILMGHSIGGIFIRDYVAHFPAEVAGLVFIDSSTPFQDRNPGFTGLPQPRTKSDKRTEIVTQSWLFNLVMIAGVPRLLGVCTGDRGSDEQLRKLQGEDICRLRQNAWEEVDQDNFDRSFQETVNSGPFGAMPILIISHDPVKQMPANPSRRDMERQNAWSQMQEDLKKLSTRSRRVVAKNSTHYVTLDRPDLIEKEVPVFIEEIRGSAPPPTTYGSTSTE